MFSKRELNVANIKFNILNTLIRLCKQDDFENIYVIDLCKIVGISKVTFFKYFPQKESLLLYYRSIIHIRLSIQLSEKKLTGLAGIEYLIDFMANEYASNPGMVLRMIEHLTTTTSLIKVFPVKPAEKALYFKGMDLKDIEMLTFHQHLERFALDAILNREVRHEVIPERLADIIFSSIYGAIVVSKLKGNSELRVYVQNVVHDLIKLLK